MPFTLDKEIAAALGALFGGQPPPPPAPVGDVAARREVIGGLMQVIGSKIPSDLYSDVTVTDHHTTTSDNHNLLLRWYTKNSTPPPGSAILYTHGGGLICSTVNDYDLILKTLASASGIPIMAVDYRLAPEVSGTTPVKDVYAGLSYLHSHAAELGVDRNRIIAMGDSAGGGLAASLTHYVKLRGGPPIARQVLIYPMLDDRTVFQPKEPNLEPFLLWNYNDNETGWRALLGDRTGGEDVTPVEAAGRMTVEDARGLPPAYIDVGELDLFRDEDLEYARKLGKAGVPCELHLLAGVPHVFEGVAPEAHVSQWAQQQRIRVLKSV